MDILAMRTLVKEGKEFIKAARHTRALIRAAHSKESPGGIALTEDEKREVIEDFAQTAEELGDVLDMGQEVGKEVAAFIKSKFGAYSTR